MKFPTRRDHERTGAGEPGVFAADSVIRRVHRERIVGALYGPVAVMTMALDPVAFAGFVSGTDDGQSLVGRFIATARTQEAIILGTEDQAREAIHRVTHLHSQVQGTLPRQIGDVPAGTSYDANDPELQLWVIVCLFSAAQGVYERFIRPLTDDDRNELWQEHLDLAAMLGYPRHLGPLSYSACRQYLHHRIDNARLSDEQRQLAINASLRIPVRRRFRPLLAVVQCAVTGLLPARLRALYGLRWTPVTALAFELIVIATRRLGAIMPAGVMHGTIADPLAEYHRRRQPA